jgi:Zn-dependent peptidase ImmA (M78 family)/DNA-binding XRE family transcriptional regulator
MPNINSEMIKLAREARGLSQADLCDRLAIAQGTISKIENKLMECTEELLEKIASNLNYPVTFFKRNDLIFPSSILYYRRKIAVGKKVLSKSEARMNIIRMGVERLLEEIELPENTLGKWDVDKMGPPQLAAKFLRERWRLPKGRIDNLTSILEKNGIVVFHFDFETDKLDGLSFFTEKGQPIIFVNRLLPGDRLRLTIAHELAHLFLHIGQPILLDRDIETEAFTFAAEFLVPLQEFKANVTSIDLKFLANQKRYWMISMSALVYISRENKLITENQAKYLFAQMSSLGYRKSEPAELGVEKERPLMIKSIIDLYKTTLGYSLEELASLLHLSFKDFESEFNLEPFGLKVLRRN